MSKDDELHTCPACQTTVKCIDAMVSTKQLAQALDIHTMTVYNWVKRRPKDLPDGAVVEHQIGEKTYRMWNLGKMRRWYINRSAAGVGVSCRKNKHRARKPRVKVADKWARGEVG